ncbi:methionine--tRNA ligase subunit beta [Candidatus Pyrohabitans sp.]
MGEKVTIEDFEKLELRVGVVKSAEEIEGSDKLLKILVDIGEERQLVAGIKRWYSPEQLVGKHIVVLANLKPAKLFGVLSEGMLLAAQDEQGVALLTAEGEPGGRVR